MRYQRGKESKLKFLWEREVQRKTVGKREYLYIGAGIFTIIFCIIEMDKPDKPHHFELHIYNMKSGVQDKLMNDYNTMSM
ncbi:Photosynthetic NDH subunit of subcomplex B 5 [Spatholobus suberectus]|nr:Photosynthetic NDH subunit of subcomplex B 5 [Spatholobus suberectus]